MSPRVTDAIGESACATRIYQKKEPNQSPDSDVSTSYVTNNATRAVCKKPRRLSSDEKQIQQ